MDYAHRVENKLRETYPELCMEPVICYWVTVETLGFETAGWMFGENSYEKYSPYVFGAGCEFRIPDHTKD